MNGSNLWDILSMLGSLALIILVLALTYFGTRWYARRMGQAGGTGKYIKVLDRTVIGSGASLVIVRVDDRYYLLGVSDKSVRLVSELPDFGQHLGNEPQQASAPFSQMFRKILNKIPDENHKDDGDRQ